MRNFVITDVSLYSDARGQNLLAFEAFGQSFLVHLRPSTAPLYPQFQLVAAEGGERRMDLFRNTKFYSASVKGLPFSSGFVTVGVEPGNVHAKLDFYDNSLILEPTDGNKTLVYWVSRPSNPATLQESDLSLEQLNGTSATDFLGSPPPPVSFAPEPFFQRFLAKRDSEPVRKNRCEIKLVADYAFFALIGHHNYANAARYLASGPGFR